MATITTAPGLISIDPIQGLVDYVHEIKPYHTKVFEVLFEYVYQDNVNTTVKDVMSLDIETNQVYVVSGVDPGILPTPLFTIEVLGQGYTDGVYTDVPFTGGTGIGALGTVTITTLTVYVYDDMTDTSVPTLVQRMSVLFTSLPPGYTPGDILSTPNSNIGGTGPTLNVTLVGTNSVVANQFWYNPSTDTLYIRNSSNSGWIAFQTQLPAIPAGGGTTDTTITEFIETISFDWGGDYTFEIAGVNDNQITVGGNYSNAILVGDVAQIDSNPPVEVTGILYDLINDQTVITVSDPTGAAVSGTLTIQNIDVTYWFAFGITDVNPIATPPSQSPDVPGDDGEPSVRAATNALIASIDGGASDVPSITVMGNATTSVQIGTLFRITGSNSNDGVYKAVYVQYEPIGNTTTIGVGPNLGDGPISLDVDSSGQVVPYRFIDEVFTGSYDNGGYDAQPYDENAGSLIHQGP